MHDRALPVAIAIAAAELFFDAFEPFVGFVARYSALHGDEQAARESAHG